MYDTDIFDIYEELLIDEPKSQAVINVIKRQYIDKSKMDELLIQLHLMSHSDIFAFLIVYSCFKVVCVYVLTIRKSIIPRKNHTWNSARLISNVLQMRKTG